MANDASSFVVGERVETVRAEDPARVSPLVPFVALVAGDAVTAGVATHLRVWGLAQLAGTLAEDCAAMPRTGERGGWLREFLVRDFAARHCGER